MVIGDFLGYSSLGLGSVRLQSAHVPERPGVTLEAKVDPQAPHQYSVLEAKPVIPPPEQPTEAKSSSKRANQNTDPVSRAFLSVADYRPTYHRIDIKV